MVMSTRNLFSLGRGEDLRNAISNQVINLPTDSLLQYSQFSEGWIMSSDEIKMLSYGTTLKRSLGPGLLSHRLLQAVPESLLLGDTVND